jgi:hypothetical protein
MQDRNIQVLWIVISHTVACDYVNNYLIEEYGCETWSRTLREEYRLRVFGNRMLRRIFGS